MNNWISVKDVLPKPYTDVLFFDAIGTGYGYVDNKYDWYWFSSSGKTACKNVTHWQTLPDPPNEKEETVTISKEEYKQLIEDHRFLSCLEEAGVDNWRGYGDAWELFEEEE